MAWEGCDTFEMQGSEKMRVLLPASLSVMSGKETIENYAGTATYKKYGGNLTMLPPYFLFVKIDFWGAFLGTSLPFPATSQLFPQFPRHFPKNW